MSKWFSAWFVTVLEDIENLNGDQRTWGYYLDKEDAVKSLHKNRTDMRENTYDYAVIECIGEGIVAYVTERQWFEWNEELNGYYEIEEPDCVKNIVNFAIG